MAIRDSGVQSRLPREREDVARQQRLAREVMELRRENARLQAKLQQAEAIVDVHDRASRILGLPGEGGRPFEGRVE